MQDKIVMQENTTVNTFDGVIEARPDSTIISAIKQESFSGPLPHPSVLEGYEKLREGSIDQIFTMADREQQFRMETVRREEDQKDRLIVIAEKESEHNIKMEVRGQRVGTLVLFACVLCAVTGAFVGWPWERIALFLGGPVVVMLGGLISGSRDERNKKADK